MWVKTQDKEALLNVQYFELLEDKEGFKIVSIDRGTVLGIYTIKEKAIKVLDLIANQISANSRRYMTDSRWSDANCNYIEQEMVFQMPKDYKNEQTIN